MEESTQNTILPHIIPVVKMSPNTMEEGMVEQPSLEPIAICGMCKYHYISQLLEDILRHAFSCSMSIAGRRRLALLLLEYASG